MTRASVWIVTPELHRRSGTERCLSEQVERWKKRFDLTLFTMEVGDVDLRGVTVHMIPRPPGPNLLRYLWWFRKNRRVRKAVASRQGAPDVVYSPGVNCVDADVMTVHIIFQKHWEVVRASTLAELRNPRLFPRALHHILFWKLMHRLERRVYGGQARLAALSHRDADDLCERFHRETADVVVIPHGVDTVHFSPVKRNEARPAAREALSLRAEQIVCMVLGNDLHKKGMDVAIRALPALPPDVVLVFLVAEPLRGQLLALAAANDVTDRVVIIATDPAIDVRDRYAAADILVQPSREDAFSMPPLEAMASGLPVVVSAALGFTELVHDGEDALVTKDPEDPLELSLAIRRLVEDEVLRDSLAKKGLALAESLSWEENARRTGDLIDACIRGT